MKNSEALQRLFSWDVKGRFVYTRGDLRMLFHECSPPAFNATVRALIAHGQLVRAAHGVYVFPHGRSVARGRILEHIVCALRRGHYCYLSFESVLSAHGVISQIPMVMTVMTTGRRGRYDTPYGSVEFTHTTQLPSQIHEATVREPGNPLPLATVKAAYRDLLRARRNLDMVDLEQLHELGLQ